VDDPANDPTVLAGSDELTGKTIGRFQITALLGKGGMGEVYLAEDSLLKRSVALKRVSASLRANPHYRELLIKEAARASQLNDEHVAHIHDVVEHQGEVLLVMEYVDGQSLRQRMRSPVPLEEFLSIAVQCAEALLAAHQCGIVHRDIKPENIMITTKGRVKICDFGLARQDVWAEETAALDRTPTVGFRGTPAYMAPEALLNRDPDIRADLFSLGIVFYEMLAVKHPFREGNNHIATTDRIIHAIPPSLANLNAAVPRPLMAVIDRLLRKDRKDRYPNPEKLLADLKAIKLPQGVRPPRLRLRVPVIPSVIVLAVVVAIIGFLWNRKSTPSRSAPQRNLVVLPFRAINGTAENRFYSDGLTETVTARLNRLGSSIQVAPATEVRARRITTAEDARKQFSADLILAGTFDQAGSVTRFTYSLYDASNLHQLNADTIEVNASSTFQLEDRLIERIAATLVPSGGPDAGKDTARTSIAAAYDSYVQGRGYLLDASEPEHLQIAVQSLKHAADLDPSYATAYASLGQAYWAKYEDTKEPVWIPLATQACEQANDLDSRSVEAKVCLGLIASGGGQYEKAKGDFEEALRIDPANDAAYLGLGTAHEQVRDYPAAERTFRRAIELKPNFYLAYSRLGDFYRRRARYSDAAEQYQKEIGLIPNSERPYFAIGVMYIYAGRYDDAITVLRKSIDLRPTATAYSNLGSTYMRLHHFDEAIPVLQQAIKLFPRNYIVAGNLARAYYWSRDERQNSAAAYERAIQLGSDELSVNARNADAHIMLARYYAMIGRKTDSLNHLAEGLKLRPTEAEYWSIAAVVRNQLGDRAAALAALKKAIELGWAKAEIKSEIEFDNLRKDPEFTSTMEGA
jgi:serine/threonine protein kinase/Flp pilus assembly protein TadD